MSNLQTNQFPSYDRSYQKVIEDLHRWNIKITSKIDEMYENILIDMNQTFNDIHYFISLTNAYLVEQENQLEKAINNEEMNLIQERIDQIIIEIRFLQSLSFRLNHKSIQLNNPLELKYNNNEIKLITSSTEFLLHTNYRFLISRFDAIELDKYHLPMFHLTSYDNQSINECILTFNTSNLNRFINEFNSFWNLFPNNNELRLLIPQYNISFIMGKLGETSRLLAKRFQLNQIKVFTNSCPKSTERILLINGKQHDLIQDCIQEIYYNIEERNNQNQLIKQSIQFYNPASLSIDEINKIMIGNIDYGGFIQNSINVNHSRLSITENKDCSEQEDDDDDDNFWHENEDWWTIQPDNSEIIQREIVINNVYAGLIIGVNAKRIDQLKRQTGAYVYISGEMDDPIRTVIIKGTRGQVDRAFTCIENLIAQHKNNKLPIKQRRSFGKRKGK